jgi:hypothetical protein
MSLTNQIRDKLDAGVLPGVLSERMWTGYGHRPLHPTIEVRPLLPGAVVREGERLLGIVTGRTSCVESYRDVESGFPNEAQP